MDIDGFCMSLNHIRIISMSLTFEKSINQNGFIIVYELKKNY